VHSYHHANVEVDSLSVSRRDRTYLLTYVLTYIIVSVLVIKQASFTHSIRSRNVFQRLSRHKTA